MPNIENLTPITTKLLFFPVRPGNAVIFSFYIAARRFSTASNSKAKRAQRRETKGTLCNKAEICLAKNRDSSRTK